MDLQLMHNDPCPEVLVCLVGNSLSLVVAGTAYDWTACLQCPLAIYTGVWFEANICCFEANF